MSNKLPIIPPWTITEVFSTIIGFVTCWPCARALEWAKSMAKVHSHISSTQFQLILTNCKYSITNYCIENPCRKLRQKDTSKYHLQLSLAILFMLIVSFVLVVLSAESVASLYGGCVTVSVLVHYFTLVAVMWMGAEALLMFQKLVIVFVQITTKFIIGISILCWSKCNVVVHWSINMSAFLFNNCSCTDNSGPHSPHRGPGNWTCCRWWHHCSERSWNFLVSTIPSPCYQLRIILCNPLYTTFCILCLECIRLWLSIDL